MAADQVAIAIATARRLASGGRRTDDQSADQHASRILNARSGLNSGFMIAQVTAARLPAKIVRSPTAFRRFDFHFGNQEDYVSMGMSGARRLERMLHNFAPHPRIELLCACQGIDCSLAANRRTRQKSLRRRRSASPKVTPTAPRPRHQRRRHSSRPRCHRKNPALRVPNLRYLLKNVGRKVQAAGVTSVFRKSFPLNNRGSPSPSPAHKKNNHPNSIPRRGGLPICEIMPRGSACSSVMVRQEFRYLEKCVTRQNSGVASRRLQNHAELNKARSRHSTRVASQSCRQN